MLKGAEIIKKDELFYVNHDDGKEGPFLTYQEAEQIANCSDDDLIAPIDIDEYESRKVYEESFDNITAEDSTCKIISGCEYA
jgi:hypothetical protein